MPMSERLAKHSQFERLFAEKHGIDQRLLELPISVYQEIMNLGLTSIEDITMLTFPDFIGIFTDKLHVAKPIVDLVNNLGLSFAAKRPESYKPSISTIIFMHKKHDFNPPIVIKKKKSNYQKKKPYKNPLTHAGRKRQFTCASDIISRRKRWGRMDYARNLRKDGFTIKEIAEKMGLCYETTRGLLGLFKYGSPRYRKTPKIDFRAPVNFDEYKAAYDEIVGNA